MDGLSERRVKPVGFPDLSAVQGARGSAPRLHSISTALMLSLVAPEEFSFYIGPLRFTIARAIVLFSAPYLLAAWSRLPGAGSRLTDGLVAFSCAWMFIAVANVADLGAALSHAGPEVLEFAGGYFTFRVLTTTRAQVLKLFDLLCLAVSLFALLGILDSVTSHYFVHDLASTLTGYVKARQNDYRHGLLRAAGPFEHPIHFGVMCGTCIIIAVAAPIRRRLFVIAACAVGLLLSFSSGAIQSCILGVVLIVYDRLFSRFKRRWTLLIASAALAVAGAFVVSSSPISYIANSLTFDPSSSWARQYEWQNATMVLSESPWFGVGFFQWPEIAKQLGTFESVDSLWLALALGYGLPGAILVAASVVSAACARTGENGVQAISGDVDAGSREPKVRVGENGSRQDSPAPIQFDRSGSGSGKTSDRDTSRLHTLLSILLGLTIYLGFTVDYWAALWVFIGVLMGLRTSPAFVR